MNERAVHEGLLKRRTFLARAGAIAVGLAVAAPLLTVQVSAQSGEVVVPDTGGALGEAMKIAYFDPFTAETGINVVLNAGNFDASVVLAQTLAGAPPYDINNPNGATVQAYVAQGALEPIDYSQWDEGLKDQIGPVPAGEFWVPAYYIAMVPSWSTKLCPDADINGWADLFDTAKCPGMRAFPPGAWGAGGGIFEAALLADGVAPEDLYPLDIDRALAKLKASKDEILKFWESGAESVQLVADEQAAAVGAWNGRVNGAIDAGTPITHTWDQAILQYDVWGILKGAKNAENAQKLLAFMQRPDRQQEFANHITYSPGNAAALEALPEERKALMPTVEANLANAVTQDYAWYGATAEGSDKTNEQVAIEKWQEWISTY